jgi:acetyltransferase-like isoleucine patch superfamily enzyme
MKDNYIKLKQVCEEGNISTLYVLLYSLFYRILHKKNIFLHPNVKIYGNKNITTKGKRILLGLRTVNFATPKEKTFLNIRGQLIFKGGFSIGKGCKIDVREGGVLEIGKGGYMNSYTQMVVVHKVTIGDNCAISWDCQFLDEDFHHIYYPHKTKNPNKVPKKNDIYIGNNVWIGCGVKIYKGSYIADGSVVASNSIVKGKFDHKNSLIGGHPAKLLKEGAHWK